MAEIIIAFSRIEDGNSIRSALVRRGLSVVNVCRSGSYVLNTTDRLAGGGIVVCGYKLADMIYSELFENLPPGFQMVVVTSPSRVEDISTDRVVFEPLPLNINSLCRTLEMLESTSISRRRDRRPRKRTAEEEELITKAKNLLMEKNGMTEPEAHRFIQRKSMDSGDSFVETAEKIFLIYG